HHRHHHHQSKLAMLGRTKKWLKMCENWSVYYPSEKLYRRVYKGLPLPVRGIVWSKILGTQKLVTDNPGVYEKMKMAGRQWCLDVRQIDLDVNRTFRNHIMFRRRYDVKQQALFNILVAYAMYNSDVGYCQGMSQIAALVLMFLNEEDAFWALASLINGSRYKMHGFFIPGFPKLLRYQDHYNLVLKKLMPKVKKHLDKHEMFPSLYTLKWLMQCFLDRIPFSLTLRFWDIFVLEGESVLIAMCIVVIKLHRSQIVKMNMDELMQFFNDDLCRSFAADDDVAVASLKNTIDDLRRLKLHLPPTTPESELLERP
ncbi:hypothetical protein HELRODRAFT_84860, partial [Helobdella robusta]|uniref:Rab-GAP TBC domain-containing protein n=1 Tax=Helobdella robusta TaxID=6412 RepID=T1G5P7_HELRO